MISSVSSQAGIVASRRKKLDQTGFNSYRNVKVENYNPTNFAFSIPHTHSSFILRHIYQYNKTNNTFTFLGTQKAQALKRVKTYINEITLYGFQDTNINGSYSYASGGEIQYKNNSYNTFLYKNGIVGNGSYSMIMNYRDQLFFLCKDNIENIADVYIDFNNYTATLNVIDTDTYPYDNTPPTLNVLYNQAFINNTSLNNINKNRLYNTTDPDLNKDQLEADVNFNIYDIFSEKNLVHNQRVFVDIRWVNFNGRGDYSFLGEDWNSVTMNPRKGHVYRAGIIIRDNIIDSMLYFSDLVDNLRMRAGNHCNPNTI